MTNLEWLKQTWIEQIKKLTVDELYEILTNGTISGGICKYCEEIFPPCKDTLENDDICRERFRIMCSQDYREENADVDL